MTRILHIILMLAATAAFAMSAAYVDDDEREDDEHYGGVSRFVKDPRCLRKEDRNHIEAIISLLCRGEFCSAENLWVEFLQEKSDCYSPRDTRRIADSIYIAVRDGNDTKRIHLQDKVRFHSERLHAAREQIYNLKKGLSEARRCGRALVLVYSINRRWYFGAPAVRDERWQEMSYNHIKSSISWWEGEARNIENDLERAYQELRQYQRYRERWWSQHRNDCHRVLYLHLPQR